LRKVQHVISAKTGKRVTIYIDTEWAEYQVWQPDLKNGTEDSAYHTSCAVDAFDTAKEMILA